ncbi:HrpJ domain-containing protein [uncultured Methylobacterium sp.]|jgi:type III secretion system YopN/LcrE/InvE/MxiC family regulator|uniref:HrpJ domain-containing protein n=1 Tax=uncultured Methylobacterium sp. TaxID=157278 RepID=UPI0026201FEF|nr:HrpJ domain-containing protein [uncultured Methylobacterium sp.]
MSGSSEIGRQTVAAFNMVSPVGAEIVHEAQGRYRGEAVSVSSEESRLTDAAEELGMSVAHRADKKSLGERTIRPGRMVDPEAIARLQGYLDKLPDMPREAALLALVEQIETFQERLRGDGEAPTRDDVLAALRAFDGDVTHQYAGLEAARAHAEATGADPALLALLDEARAEFQKTDLARDVHAGFAVAEIASRAAATLETDPAAVRDAYRAMLRDSMHVGQLFDALARFDVLRSFGEAVETFRTAAGRDLASTGPSTDPAFLHGLLTELGKLKKMQTVFDATRQLIHLTERGRRLGASADPVEQTSRLLNFAAQASAGPADARRLLGAFAERALAVQIAYANGLRGLHGEIPDDAMPSLASRLQQGKAILALLDDLVAEEEREEEAAGDGPDTAAGRPVTAPREERR